LLVASKLHLLPVTHDELQSYSQILSWSQAS